MGDKYNPECVLPWDWCSWESACQVEIIRTCVGRKKKLRHSLLGNGDPLWAFRWGSEEMKIRIF